jgi:hypothetical protein
VVQRNLSLSARSKPGFVTADNPKGAIEREFIQRLEDPLDIIAQNPVLGLVSGAKDDKIRTCRPKRKTMVILSEDPSSVYQVFGNGRHDGKTKRPPGLGGRS